MSAGYRNPVCGHPDEDFTAAEAGDLPRSGSVGVCAYCGTVTIFTGVGLLQRAPTPAELAEVLADPTVARLQAHFAGDRR